MYGRDLDLGTHDATKGHDQHLDEINQIRRLIRWPRNWPKLTAHDVENGLCEFDKYCRMKLEGRKLKPYKSVS
jgi:hypothetical protein